MSNLIRNSQACFPKCACHFMSPPSTYQRALIALQFAILNINIGASAWLYLLLVLICMSLLSTQVEHFFMGFLSICLSPFVMVCLNGLPIFKIRLVVFVSVKWSASFYIPDINPLTNTYSAKLFSQLTVSLFVSSRWLFFNF